MQSQMHRTHQNSQLHSKAKPITKAVQSLDIELKGVIHVVPFLKAIITRLTVNSLNQTQLIRPKKLYVCFLLPYNVTTLFFCANPKHFVAILTHTC